MVKKDFTPQSWFVGQKDNCVEPGVFPEKPYCFILTGAPGCGKGTQAAFIKDRFHCCHLSTGEIFRHIKCGNEDCQTPAMREAVAAMDSGSLVTDETVIELVRERGHCLSCNFGFILDGFPRTINQAEALDEMLKERGIQLDAVIHYEVPVEEVLRRIEGRRKQAEAEGKTRADDTPEVALQRIETYDKTIAPVLDHYKEQDKLCVVTADGTPPEVFEKTLKTLETKIKSMRG